MDFETWWKNFGQFMHPCSQMQSPMLEQFRGFAALVWNVACESRDDEVRQAFEQGKEEILSKLADNKAYGKVGS